MNQFHTPNPPKDGTTANSNPGQRISKEETTPHSTFYNIFISTIIVENTVRVISPETLA